MRHSLVDEGWSTKDGWPMGMCQLFLWHDGRIWVTTSEHKARVKALRSRSKSCIVVSGEGNEVGGDRSLSIKTTSQIHSDQAIKDWFFPLLAAKQYPNDPSMREIFIGLLDSPGRVIIEHEPIKYVSYDGIAMGESLAKEMSGQ